MNMDLIQSMIDIVFKGNMVFLAPFLFLLMIILFSDSLMALIFNAIGDSSSSRRAKY